MGSAQAVAVDDGVLAVEAWSHLGGYDAGSLQLLGTKDLRKAFALDPVFGVATKGGVMHVAEWESVH